MRISPLKSKSGFTLIEVLIALTLLAFLGIAIYKATATSFTVSSQLTSESNDYTAIAAALAALNSDIASMYTPPIADATSANGQPVNTQEPALEVGGMSTNPTDFWSAPIKQDGTRRMRFKGSSEKLTFISNGSLRFERDLPRSDFVKITWEVEQNKSGAYSLYRTSDWDAFNYEDNKNADRKTKRVAVLSNLASGKFSYYRKTDKTWTETWDTEGAFQSAANSRYPELISFKMEVPDPVNNAVNQKWQSEFKPNLSLNFAGQLLPAQPQTLDIDAIPNPP